jgi:glycogen operon protein
VGNFPPGWAEWNDAYRDTVRGFWKGDAGLAPVLAGIVAFGLVLGADMLLRRQRS